MTWPQPSWRERTNLYSRCLSVGRRKSMEYRGFMKVSISSKWLPITTLCGKPFWNLQKPIDSRLRVVSAPLWIECWTKRLGGRCPNLQRTKSSRNRTSTRGTPIIHCSRPEDPAICRCHCDVDSSERDLQRT